MIQDRSTYEYRMIKITISITRPNKNLAQSLSLMGGVLEIWVSGFRNMPWKLIFQSIFVT